jgi:hypothetical protein
MPIFDDGYPECAPPTIEKTPFQAENQKAQQTAKALHQTAPAETAGHRKPVWATKIRVMALIPL